jgi:hypothetical protein
MVFALLYTDIINNCLVVIFLLSDKLIVQILKVSVLCEGEILRDIKRMVYDIYK